jgi:hypothetical protein
MFRAITLPVGGLAAEEFLRFQATDRPHIEYIIPQAVSHSLMLLSMGKIIARNMSIGIINKQLLLRLVGCLRY